ncbi:MAG: hypothetical protein ACREM1_05660, partial [Longimicrobiales bacterium]
EQISCFRYATRNAASNESTKKGDVPDAWLRPGTWVIGRKGTFGRIMNKSLTSETPARMIMPSAPETAYARRRLRNPPAEIL